MIVEQTAAAENNSDLCNTKSVKEQRAQGSCLKCGPDYIDPMFHSEIIGTNSRNIDLFYAGKGRQDTFCQNSENTDVSVVEGVMGFYDGVGGNTGENLHGIYQTSLEFLQFCS